APIHGRAGRAGEVPAHAAAALDDALDHAGDAPARADDAPRFVGADAIHLGRAAVRRDALPRRRHRVERIPPREPLTVDPDLQVIGIGAGELAAVVVEAHAVLRAARLEPRLVAARIEPEIVAADLHLGDVGALEVSDFSAVARRGLQV